MGFLDNLFKREKNGPSKTDKWPKIDGVDISEEINKGIDELKKAGYGSVVIDQVKEKISKIIQENNGKSAKIVLNQIKLSEIGGKLQTIKKAKERLEIQAENQGKLSQTDKIFQKLYGDEYRNNGSDYTEELINNRRQYAQTEFDIKHGHRKNSELAGLLIQSLRLHGCGETVIKEVETKLSKVSPELQGADLIRTMNSIANSYITRNNRLIENYTDKYVNALLIVPVSNALGMSGEQGKNQLIKQLLSYNDIELKARYGEIDSKVLIPADNSQQIAARYKEIIEKYRDDEYLSEILETESKTEQIKSLCAHLDGIGFEERMANIVTLRNQIKEMPELNISSKNSLKAEATQTESKKIGSNEPKMETPKIGGVRPQRQSMSESEKEEKRYRDFKSKDRDNAISLLSVFENKHLIGLRPKSQYTRINGPKVDKYNSLDNSDKIFDCDIIQEEQRKNGKEPIEIKKEYIFIPYMQSLDNLHCLGMKGITGIEMRKVYYDYKKDDEQTKMAKLAVGLGMLKQLGIVDDLSNNVFAEHISSFKDGEDYKKKILSLAETVGIDSNFKGLFSQDREQNDTISMKATVENAIKSGVTKEDVEKSYRAENQLQQAKQFQQKGEKGD